MQFSSLGEPIVLIKLLPLNIGTIYEHQKFQFAHLYYLFIFFIKESDRNQDDIVALIVHELLMIQYSDSCGVQ